MEWGLTRGLAVDLGYNQKINDLRYNAYQDRVASAEAEARAKMFAEDLSFKSPMNAYDAPMAKEYAYQKMKEIGDFAKNNPNYRYDPMLQVELKKLKTDIKDNQIINRGMVVDQAYSEYLKDRQEAVKSPTQWDTELLDAEGKKFENYFNHGHPEGIDGKNTQGEQPVIYTRPKMFIDMPTHLQGIGKSIEDGHPVKGDNPGEWWLEPKSEQVDALVHSVLQEHGRQLSVEARKQGIPEEKVPQWTKDQILSSFDNQYHIGDPDALWRRKIDLMKLQAERDKSAPKPSYTAFDYIADKNTLAGDLKDDESRILTGDRPKIILQGKVQKNPYDPNDATAQIREKVDLTGLDFHSDGKYVKGRDGIPVVLGHVKVPVSIAAAKGIITKYDNGDETTESFNKTKGRISEAFIGQAAWAKDVDNNGKPYNYINVRYQIPFNPQDRKLRQRFNSLVEVSRNTPPADDPYQDSQSTQKKRAPEGAGVDREGNVFDASGKYLGKRDEFQ